MMTFHLKTVLSNLLLGFVLGFVTAFLFEDCNKRPTIKKETVVRLKGLKKQAVTISHKTTVNRHLVLTSMRWGV